jgi:hypothetical protein
MARIVDMVFHHAAADVIPRAEQHAAALFLVELAGLPPCRSPDAQVVQGSVGRPAFDWWRRPTTDPRKSTQPDCGEFAEGPLAGAIAPQPAPAVSPAAPTFAVRRFLFDGSGGAATVFVHPDADVDPEKNIAASGRLPGSGTSIRAVASVAASGSPAEVARWQVGFVQTIVSDRVVANYVGGQRVRFELPVPIRDGARRDRAAPPWFDPGLVDTLTAPGSLAIAGLFAEPWMFFPYHFMDPAQRGRMKEVQDPKDPKKSKKVPLDEIDHGNVVNRAHRATVFNTWLVARRDDAPLDRFSTQFLAGRMVAWTQRADFIGAAGTGSFDASVDPTPLADTTDMQLAGPTAAELEPPTAGGTPSPREVMRSRRVVEVAEAPPKAKGVGLSFADYGARIQKIADEIEPLRRALDITDALFIRIRIDPTTGRVAIHRPPERPAADARFMTGDTDVTYRAAMARFAEEIVFRARKDLVLADTAKIANAGFMPVVIRAISEQKRPKDVMSPQRGLGMAGLLAEAQLDTESETRRAANPGVFDPEFRVPVTVAFDSERYLFDFTRSFDAVQTACGNKRGPKSLACTVPEFANKEQLSVDVKSAPELLGVDVLASPIAVKVTLSPVTVQMFIPSDGLGFEGMSGRGVTQDSLIHELHHLIDERQLIQSLKTRLARAILVRVMELRRLAASDRSMRAGALTKGAIEAVVWDEYGRYYADYLREGDRLSDIVHISEDQPVLTEAEVQRLWPEFQMPKRFPHRGSFEP